MGGVGLSFQWNDVEAGFYLEVEAVVVDELYYIHGMRKTVVVDVLFDLIPVYLVF